MVGTRCGLKLNRKTKVMRKISKNVWSIKLSISLAFSLKLSIKRKCFRFYFRLFIFYVCVHGPVIDIHIFILVSHVKSFFVLYFLCNDLVIKRKWPTSIKNDESGFLIYQCCLNFIHECDEILLCREYINPN